MSYYVLRAMLDELARSTMLLPADAEHLPSSQNNRGQGSEGEQGERDGGDDVLHEVSPAVTA